MAGSNVCSASPAEELGGVVTRDKNSHDAAAELRRRAEAQLRKQSARKSALPAGAEALRQLHELQVHQIELEMQNLELQQVRDELEISLERYVVLYDFAPVGYATLDRGGVILELNLNVASLLGQARSTLIGRGLVEFLAADSRRGYSAFLTAVFASDSVISSSEVLLSQPPLRVVRFEGVVDKSRHTCRLVMIDISEREFARRVLQESEQYTSRLLAQNRALTRRVLSLQENERRNTARELHDELGQWLTAISAEAEAILSTPQTMATEASASAIRDSTTQIQHLVRRMLHRLRPQLTQMLSLAASLEALVADWRRHQSQVQCELTMEGDLRELNEELAISIYRIVQEALSNIAKHARAGRVSIRLWRVRRATDTTELLLLNIEDDGQGMDLMLPHAGFGLMGMRERAIAGGGQLTVNSVPRQGVRIVAHWPLNPTDRSEGVGVDRPSVS